MEERAGKTALNYRLKPKFKYFFLEIDDEQHLHQLLRRNISLDRCIAYDHKDKQRRGYSWSSVRKHMEHAHTTGQTAKLLGRHLDSIWNYIHAGAIEWPQRTTDLKTGVLGWHYLSDSDILDLHDYMIHLHIGRPRSDGDITNNRSVHRSALSSVLRSKELLYKKDNDGNFVPVWKV